MIDKTVLQIEPVSDTNTIECIEQEVHTSWTYGILIT